MIKAKHNKWAELLFYPYMNRLIKKNFSSFYLVNDFPFIPEGHALVITPNHISWWDGFFAQFTFSRYLNRRFHVMMLEEQLKHYSFFKRLGAFSVDPGNPKSVVQTAAYTQEILNNLHNYVVVYPQGEIESFEKQPLSLKRGLRFFLRGMNKKCLVLPVGFKIQYYDKKHPAVIARFGDLIDAEEVVNNYDCYVSRFHENLTLLSEASFYKNFKTTLFDKYGNS